ncbi:ATP-binding cassette subfamily C protein [Roseinatronobacter thiooxidans]|uniref:ATP-binding cassette subfamily C protein n=1 Tax=Roseinatronobacter thiooxidans TaxID=121821 RepID=A0A2W7QAI5_9RHOB|nr:type I secretion system permease/ATPase [Roseinatronobacter thiooxidans]PZX45698.1 ATP-binding cassette subfamily C protein [Roseinatronobacter thiooxidans]
MSNHPDDLKAARAENRGLLTRVGLFSVFVNLLMLTGPLFMLQIYDRVLSSRSEPTLVALFVLVAFLYLMMALLDHSRGLLVARVAARFQDRLDRRVLGATMQRLAVRAGDPLAQTAQRDLDGIHRFVGSRVFLALFDMPWAPIFLAAIFIFHPLLGVVALTGGAILVAIALTNQRLTKDRQQKAMQLSEEAMRLEGQLKNEAETIQSLGMMETVMGRWQKARRAALEADVGAKDRADGFSTTSRTFRLFLQSAILAAGAWLVLQNALTPGAMIAASILLGRALAPVDATIGQWASVQRAQEGWQRLSQLLREVPPAPQRTPLPRPDGRLDVQSITVTPPGDTRYVLRMLAFALEPGQALGVIGPSGSGKSTLARALVGSWRLAGGRIRLGGAPLDQYDPDMLGRLIGYLPQRVALFEGTIAENICRFDHDPDPNDIINAARDAGVHELILSLPEGYDTRIDARGGRLSGGQAQRVGLARALYGAPALLVLDEPDAHIDREGVAALDLTIQNCRERGTTVVVIAHRPAALQSCDLLLVLENGTRVAFGPHAEVMANMGKKKPSKFQGRIMGAAP